MLDPYASKEKSMESTLFFGTQGQEWTPTRRNGQAAWTLLAVSMNQSMHSKDSVWMLHH